MGQLVGSVQARSSVCNLDLSAFGTGMYIIQPEVDGQLQVPVRVMIQH